MTTVRLILLLGLAALLPAQVDVNARPRRAERSREYDVMHYRIQLKLNDAARSLDGETRITLRPLRDGFDTLVLDAETFRVTAVEQLRFEQTPGKLTVHLSRPYRFHEELSVTVSYRAENVAIDPERYGMQKGYGLGISFKPMDKLTVNADVQFTQWSKVQEIEAVYDNPMWQALFAAGGKLDLKWDDAIQYRFGLEYAVSEKLALRAGYYYDPTPSPVETLSILLPEFTYNVVTAGFGYKTEKISLDFCFEALMGKDVESPLAGGAMPGTHGMNILVPNIAFTYRF